VHVADELLRDRARATRVALHGVLQRAGDPDDVDAVVLIKALILDGNERLTDVPISVRFSRPTSPINEPSRANTSDDCGGTMIRHASFDGRSCAAALVETAVRNTTPRRSAARWGPRRERAPAPTALVAAVAFLYRVQSLLIEHTLTCAVEMAVLRV
jgi:hypothetical protein